MQILLALIASTAKSISASLHTIAGAFPPSSKETLIIFLAAASITLVPASTLPVRLTIPIFSLLDNSYPTTLPLPATKLKTPFGKELCETSFANSKALFGVSLLGFITIVFPVSKAGAIFLAIKKNGKFQGKIPPITPIALLYKYICSLALSLCMISPSYLLAHSAV